MKHASVAAISVIAMISCLTAGAQTAAPADKNDGSLGLKPIVLQQLSYSSLLGPIKPDNLAGAVGPGNRISISPPSRIIVPSPLPIGRTIPFASNKGTATAYGNGTGYAQRQLAAQPGPLDVMIIGPYAPKQDTAAPANKQSASLQAPLIGPYAVNPKQGPTGPAAAATNPMAAYDAPILELHTILLIDNSLDPLSLPMLRLGVEQNATPPAAVSFGPGFLPSRVMVPPEVEKAVEEKPTAKENKPVRRTYYGIPGF